MCLKYEIINKNTGGFIGITVSKRVSMAATRRDLGIVTIINVHIQSTQMHICVTFDISDTCISRFTDISVAKHIKYGYQIKSTWNIVQIIGVNIHSL